MINEPDQFDVRTPGKRLLMFKGYVDERGQLMIRVSHGKNYEDLSISDLTQETLHSFYQYQIKNWKAEG